MRHDFIDYTIAMVLAIVGLLLFVVALIGYEDFQHRRLINKQLEMEINR